MFNSEPKKPAEPVPPPVLKPTAAPKGRVLLADDDAVVRRALGLKLSAAGYQVLNAEDGAQAVSIARKEKPDVIILDINFPPEPGVMWDGFRLMQWLHRPSETMRIPVIIITGEQSAKHRDTALAAGAAGFFHKPVDNQSLIAVVEKLIGAASEPPKA